MGERFRQREETVQSYKSGVSLGFRRLGKGALWLEQRDGESSKTQRKGAVGRDLEETLIPLKGHSY